MNLVYSEIGKKKKYITVTLIIKTFATLTELFIPLLLTYLIDNIIPKENIVEIILYGCLMLFATILTFVGNVVANRMSSRSSTLITKEVRKQLFYKVQYLSSKQVDEVTIPTLVTRLTTDTYNVHQVIGMVQRAGVRAPILVVGGIIITLIISPILSLILVLLLPFIVFIALRTSKKSFPIYQDVQRKIDKQVEVVRENISGIRVIKSLSKEEYEKDRFNVANKETNDAEKKAAFLMSKMWPLIGLILNVGLVLVILVGGFLIDKGLLQPGAIVGYMLIFSYIVNSMLMITRVFTLLAKAKASIDRVQEIMDLEDDLLLEEASKIDTDDYIVFDNVSFSYNGVKNDLENINIRIKKGESLGILGGTGTGKSTLINLLLRLYDPQVGNIYLEGKNIKSINEEEFRKNFGVVFQNDIIFGDTVRNNINFYRELSDEKIKNAIDNSQALFINQLEDGLDHQVSSRGLNLSGGQRQRVLLARSMASHPNILVLDDASSALDYKTDAQLRKNINQNYKDTTLVIVAQRISSVMNCEKIIILNDGKIEAQGTHKELLEKSTTYQTIYQLQMGAVNE